MPWPDRGPGSERIGAAVGFRLTERWSVMATIEHMSNAGLCIENRGLTRKPTAAASRNIGEQPSELKVLGTSIFGPV
jgi:hypothetical protein